MIITNKEVRISLPDTVLILQLHKFVYPVIHGCILSIDV